MRPYDWLSSISENLYKEKETAINQSIVNPKKKHSINQLLNQTINQHSAVINSHLVLVGIQIVTEMQRMISDLQNQIFPSADTRGREDLSKRFACTEL